MGYLIKVLTIFCLFVMPAMVIAADEYTVQPGDTLSGILSEYYTPDEISKIAKEIRSQCPGFVLRSGMEMERSLDSFSLQISIDKEARIYREDGDPKVIILNYEELLMPTVITGTITSTLFSAVQEMGESSELAASLARIFEWEVDFFRDVHPNDTFTVLVEKRFVRDKYVGYGKILAAEFNVKKKKHTAFLYNDGQKSAYFNEKAQALERGFLRVPLSYARITSRFTDSRLHPVLGEVRPHYGVDYAAPTGTPVMVTASGTISKMSYTKSNGYYVEVRHSNGYKTYYLHLSRFNKQLKAGSQVNQGQVIGYVGSTGYATGPHLDYRIQRNGTWLNPLNFIAEPPQLNKEKKDEFLKMAAWKNELLQVHTKYVGMYQPAYIP